MELKVKGNKELDDKIRQLKYDLILLSDYAQSLRKLMKLIETDLNSIAESNITIDLIESSLRNDKNNTSG